MVKFIAALLNPMNPEFVAQGRFQLLRVDGGTTEKMIVKIVQDAMDMATALHHEKDTGKVVLFFDEVRCSR